MESGLIDSREKELAGPNPENVGYTPLLFEATQTGIYEVEFHSVLPESGGTRNPSPVSVDTIYTNENQAAGVAAWDITVKNENGDAVPGRGYSFSLALNTGDRKKVPGYSTPLNSDIYILTKDGYLYNIDLNGADPYGFIKMCIRDRGYTVLLWNRKGNRQSGRQCVYLGGKGQKKSMDGWNR